MYSTGKGLYKEHKTPTYIGRIYEQDSHVNDKIGEIEMFLIIIS